MIKEETIAQPSNSATELLKNRQFLLLWIAQIVSQTAQQMINFALILQGPKADWRKPVIACAGTRPVSSLSMLMLLYPLPRPTICSRSCPLRTTHAAWCTSPTLARLAK